MSPDIKGTGDNRNINSLKNDHAPLAVATWKEGARMALPQAEDDVSARVTDTDIPIRFHCRPLDITVQSKRERRARRLVKYSDGVLTRAKASALSSIAAIREAGAADPK